MTVTWNAAEMSTGNAEIDAQHRQLIEKLNELIAAMKKGAGRPALAPTLNWLGQYAQTHFTHEERCMAEARCPVAAVNARAHKQFLATFTRLKQAIEANTGPTSAHVLEVERELAQWITAHIVGVDTKLRECSPARMGAAR